MADLSLWCSSRSLCRERQFNSCAQLQYETSADKRYPKERFGQNHSTQKMPSKCSRQPYSVTYDPSARNNKHFPTEHNAHLLGYWVLYYQPAVLEWVLAALAPLAGAFLSHWYASGTVFKSGNYPWCKAGVSRAGSRSSPKVAAQNQRVSAYQRESVYFLIAYARSSLTWGSSLQHCFSSLNSKCKSSYAPPALLLFFERNCFSGSLVCQLVSL